MWKVIGKSVLGTAHFERAEACQDALVYKVIPLAHGGEAFVFFASDGAGTAMYAQEAAQMTVAKALDAALKYIEEDVYIDEDKLRDLVKSTYTQLCDFALERRVPKNEYSCTLLGGIIMPKQSCFLQIGDGAIVKREASGLLTTVWWPHNGEYQNTTSFLVDDPALTNLKVKIYQEEFMELSVLTDGLQMLSLNNESKTVHQPFFDNLLVWLRKANHDEHIAILNAKLEDYLLGNVISSRTDDDKTLMLATRL